MCVAFREVFLISWVQHQVIESDYNDSSKSTCWKLHVLWTALRPRLTNADIESSLYFFVSRISRWWRSEQCCCYCCWTTATTATTTTTTTTTKWISLNLGRHWRVLLIWSFIVSALRGFKTQYRPLSIARCELVAAIFVMLKILKLSFAARIEFVNNSLAPMKTKTTTAAHEAWWPISCL